MVEIHLRKTTSESFILCGHKKDRNLIYLIFLFNLQIKIFIFIFVIMICTRKLTRTKKRCMSLRNHAGKCVCQDEHEEGKIHLNFKFCQNY